MIIQMSKYCIAINALIMDNKKAGIGNYAFNLLQEMLKFPSDFIIDIYIQDHMSSQFNSTENMHFIKCPNFESSRDRILYEQLKLPHLYRQYDYSLIHFMDYMSPILPIKSKKVVTIHDLSYFIYPEYFTIGSRYMKQFLTGPSIRSADRVICVSYNTKNDIQKRYKLSDKLRVIHLGVEPIEKTVNKDKGREILKKYGINGSFIMYTGTLEPRKNVETLISAYHSAVKEGNIIQDLVLCGKPGWKYEGIYNEIKNSGLSERIILTGYVPSDDLSIIFDNADVFVYPSLYEGFGLPPLEAMAHGVPVICSNSSSLPEVVGEAALTFSPEDKEALTALMIKLLEDTNLRSELVEKGYNRASLFTWENTVNKTYKVYEELLN